MMFYFLGSAIAACYLLVAHIVSTGKGGGFLFYKGQGPIAKLVTVLVLLVLWPLFLFLVLGTLIHERFTKPCSIEGGPQFTKRRVGATDESARHAKQLLDGSIRDGVRERKARGK